MRDAPKNRQRHTRRNTLQLAEAQLQGSRALLDELDLQFSFGTVPKAAILERLRQAQSLHAQAMANLQRHYLKKGGSHV